MRRTGRAEPRRLGGNRVPAMVPLPGQTGGRVCRDTATRDDVTAGAGREVSQRGFGCRDRFWGHRNLDRGAP